MTLSFSLLLSDAPGLLAADGAIAPAEQSVLAAALKASLMAIMPALARPTARFDLYVSATAASDSDSKIASKMVGSENVRAAADSRRGLASSAVAVAVTCSLVPEQLSSTAASTPSSAFASLSSAIQQSSSDGSLAALVQSNAAGNAVLQGATFGGVAGFGYTTVVQKTTGPTGQPSSRPSSLPTLAVVNPPAYVSTSLVVFGVCLGFGIVGVAALMFYLHRRSRAGSVAPAAQDQGEKQGQSKVKSRRIRVDPETHDPEMHSIVAGAGGVLSSPSLSPGPWTRLAAMTQAWTPKRNANAAAKMSAVAPAPYFLPFDFIPSSKFLSEAAAGGGGSRPTGTRPVTPDDADEEGEEAEGEGDLSMSIDVDGAERDAAILRVAQQMLRPRQEGQGQGQGQRQRQRQRPRDSRRGAAVQRGRRRRRDAYSSSEEDDSSAASRSSNEEVIENDDGF